MFGPDNRFTTDDRRLLRAIARGLTLIGQKLDLNLEVALEDLALEKRQMARLTALSEGHAKMMEAVRKNTESTEAMRLFLDGVKAELVDVNARLAEAIADDVSQEEIDALVAEQNTIVAALDADTALEAILAGTPAEPTP